MPFTVSLQQRIQQLKKAQADVPKVLAEVAKDATLRAIEAAADATPPTAGDLRGTNTRSGELKQHWDTDSIKEPKISGNTKTITISAIIAVRKNKNQLQPFDSDISIFGIIAF